jgi:glycosyltransferase involved in cell wall biosynthesis
MDTRLQASNHEPGPFLIVAADFDRTTGAGCANLAFATHLARRGHELHLVTFRAERDLLERPNVFVHRVPKPLGSYFLGEPLMDRMGRFWGSRIQARGGRVMVNGGCCRWSDINWVHFVFTGSELGAPPSFPRRLKNRITHWASVVKEKRSLRCARVVIANSNRTRDDLVAKLEIDPRVVHVVYPGVDPAQLRPATGSDLVGLRAELGWGKEERVVAFVGRPDRTKGFDTLFTAWTLLCADPQWTPNLAVIGAGTELDFWKNKAVAKGLASRIRFFGLRSDVPNILRACDALVLPSRYEPYGLAAQEALCCGLPALVTRDAGFAERYPLALQDLLIRDPADAAELADRLRGWYARRDLFAAAAASFSTTLRANTWEVMATRMSDIIEASKDSDRWTEAKFS